MESLISVIPSHPEKQNGVSDDRADKLFKHLWNMKYPLYPVRIQWNSHDFGSYPDIGISERLFFEGLSDTETFAEGIEQAATDLVDNWNTQVSSGEITIKVWQEIAKNCNLSELVPFTMEY